MEQSILTTCNTSCWKWGMDSAFETRQKRILIDEDYFFTDLVFYHRILKCHVIVELKIDKFRHEYASQLNMYLNYFKAEVMQPDDNPPIGILLCTEKGYISEICHCRIKSEYLRTEVHDRIPSEEEIKEFIASSNY